MKNHISYFIASIFLGMISCDSTRIIPLAEVQIDLTQKSTYKVPYSVLSSTYIIPYIIILDNKGMDRDFGKPIKDTALLMRLTIKNGDGNTISQKDLDYNNIRQSNLNIPNTTISLETKFKPAKIKLFRSHQDKKFMAVLEVIQPTEYDGKYPAKFVIDPPEKYH